MKMLVEHKAIHTNVGLAHTHPKILPNYEAVHVFSLSVAQGPTVNYFFCGAIIGTNTVNNI